jgi:GT2 family glycosyltransferase/predicted O-methyltransferase YrrM
MMNLAVADKVYGWHCLAQRFEAHSTPNVSKARNELVSHFLAADFEWALFLDSDMVFPEDTIVRLLMAAEHADTKIVGGLCVMATDDGPIPTIYNHAPAPAITYLHIDYPEDTLVQVAATGAACLLVHREVFEAVAAQHPGEAYPWFKEVERRRNWLSEDLEFCLRAGEAGYSVYVDTTLHIGHAKGKDIYWPSDIKTGKGFPPNPVVAVIPMRDHHELTAALVEQIKEQGGCDEIIICDNGSGPEAKTWLAEQTDVNVLDCPDVGIHAMWNRAAQLVVSRHRHFAHIAFLNNDLRLGPGCLTALSSALASNRLLTAVSANYDNRPESRATTGTPRDPVQQVEDICAGRYDGTGGLAGFAFMVRSAMFTSGYEFPEECMWWYGDNDLVASIARSNEKIGIALRAHVEHLDGGGKTAGDWFDPKWKAQLDADRQAFEAKWSRARPPASDFAALYDHVCKTPSDINEHLPTLYRVATEMGAKNVIELGTRTGVSTVAWCHAMDATGGHVWSVDITDRLVFKHPALTFVLGDDLDDATLAQLPEQADIVFVDTLHSYEQTAAEIATYKSRVRPGGCMVFHDTAVEVHEHLPPGQPPFPTQLAVDEWVDADNLALERWDNNNGLSVVWLPEAS